MLNLNNNCRPSGYQLINYKRWAFYLQVDSYSAFFNNGGFEQTELDAKFRALNITDVYVVGIALDYCVFYSSLDAKKLGYETFVIKDATRGITEAGMEHAIKTMEEAGIEIISSDALLTSYKNTEL